MTAGVNAQEWWLPGGWGLESGSVQGVEVAGARVVVVVLVLVVQVVVFCRSVEAGHEGTPCVVAPLPWPLLCRPQARKPDQTVKAVACKSRCMSCLVPGRAVPLMCGTGPSELAVQQAHWRAEHNTSSTVLGPFGAVRFACGSDNELMGCCSRYARCL